MTGQKAWLTAEVSLVISVAPSLMLGSATMVLVGVVPSPSSAGGWPVSGVVCLSAGCEEGLEGFCCSTGAFFVELVPHPILGPSSGACFPLMNQCTGSA